jgi:hypothetical protein
MEDLTEEEYNELDEYYTKNPPAVDPAKKGTGFFTRRKVAARSITVDTLSANWLMAKAVAVHKTPTEIISDMIQKEIAASCMP